MISCAEIVIVVILGHPEGLQVTVSTIRCVRVILGDVVEHFGLCGPIVESAVNSDTGCGYGKASLRHQFQSPGGVLVGNDLGLRPGQDTVQDRIAGESTGDRLVVGVEAVAAPRGCPAVAVSRRCRRSG